MTWIFKQYAITFMYATLCLTIMLMRLVSQSRCMGVFAKRRPVITTTGNF
jgi:hypothetical protein